MADLILEKHFLLLHFFHCYNLSRILELANADFTESTSSNDAHRFKILKSDLLAPKVVLDSFFRLTSSCLVQLPYEVCLA